MCSEECHQAVVVTLGTARHHGALMGAAGAPLCPQEQHRRHHDPHLQRLRPPQLLAPRHQLHAVPARRWR